MGACYSVDLKIKVKNEKGAFKALTDLMARGKEQRISYSLEEHAKEGLYPDSLENCIRIILAQWGRHIVEKREKDDGLEDGFVLYISDFDASYGWESVMMEMFRELTPYVEDGSQILIAPDNDYDLLKVINGECVQLH